MDVTTVWNIDGRSIWMLMAIYPDRHYFIHLLRTEQHVDFDHAILANTRILLCDTRKEAERLGSELGEDWIKVPSRVIGPKTS